MLRNRILLGLLGLVFPFAAQAEGGLSSQDCHCEQYAQLRQYIELSQQVGRISLRSLQLEDGTLVFSREELDAFRLELLSDEAIPWECRERFRRQTDTAWKFDVGQYLRSSKYDWSQANRGQNLAEDHKAFAFLADTRCQEIAAAGGTLPEFCSEKNILKKTQQYLALDNKTILKDFIEHWNEHESSIETDKQLNLFRIYHTALSKPTDAEANRYLASALKSLPFEERLRVTAKVGERLYMNYDKKRAIPGTPESQGVVTNKQMWDASRNNSAIGYFGDDDSESKKPPAGAIRIAVCRDIAKNLGSKVQAAGGKDTVVVTLVNAGGAHATVMTTDPKTGKRYQLDYGWVLSPEPGSEGGEALFYGPDDVTMTYRAWDVDSGKILAATPGVLQKSMTELTGVGLQKIDPLNNPGANSTMVTFRIDEKGAHEIRAGEIQDAVGGRTWGAGYTNRLSVAPGISAKTGFGIGHRTFERGLVFKDSPEQTMPFGVAQSEFKYRTPRFLEKGKGLDLFVDGAISGMYYGGLPKVYEAPAELRTDFDARADVGIRLDQGKDKLPTPKNPASSTHYVGIQGMLGHHDVRIYNPMYPVFHHGVVSSRYRHLLGDKGLASAEFAALALCGAIRCSGKAQFLLVLEKLAVDFALQGPLKEGMSPYFEGSIPRLSMGIQMMNQNPDLLLELTGSRALTVDDFRGTANLRWNLPRGEKPKN